MDEGIGLVHQFPGPSFPATFCNAIVTCPTTTAATPSLESIFEMLSNSKIVFSNSGPPTCTSQAEEQEGCDVVDGNEKAAFNSANLWCQSFHLQKSYHAAPQGWRSI